MAPFFKFCPTIFDADSTGSRSGSFALVTGVGTPDDDKICLPDLCGVGCCLDLIARGGFQLINGLLVSPVPDRPQVPGKCFGKGEADITETGRHRPFYREVFLRPRGLDSFGRIHAVITWDRPKTYREKGSLGQGIFEEVCDGVRFSGKEQPEKLFL